MKYRKSSKQKNKQSKGIEPNAETKILILKEMINLYEREDKINDILDYFPHPSERKVVADYLWALHRNKEDIIKYYESFGNHIRQITMNFNSYQKGLQFGFKDRGYNEHGWIEDVEWLNFERISLDEKKSEIFDSNGIRLGMGLNRKWAYTVNYSFGSAGGSCPLSEYSPVCDSREEAYNNGLRDLLKRHTEALNKLTDTINYKEKVIKGVISKINTLLNTEIEKQLTLF